MPVFAQPVGSRGLECSWSQSPEAAEPIRAAIGSKTAAVVCPFRDDRVGVGWFLSLFQLFELSTGSEIVLRRCEAVVFFFAMMLPIVLEGAVVYWIFQHPLKPHTSNPSFTAVGEWTDMALPQAWLVGALLVLAYRVLLIVNAPAGWREFSRTWLAFVRPWRWTIAMILMQELALFLDRTVAS